ncbi:MAG TPA: LysM peptidoglycan-binding domain-containing protein [Acidimicrobiia bacterium]|jgi:DNA-binding SARP family transcriptional activator
MNRTARITRALGALVLLGVLVVGIPWALVHYIGSPLPHHIPGWQEIHDTLGQHGIPDDVLLKALAIVVWISWALLVASLISEAVGVLRGKSARDLPLTSPFQPIARWLVASIAVGILSTSTRPVPTPQPALATSLTTVRMNTPTAELVVDLTAPPPAIPAVGAGNGAAEPTVVPQPMVYVVQSGDTLWDIAQQHLGDPYRWTEIYDLNQRQPQPDGASLTDPHWIYPGWTLQLPIATPPVSAPAPMTPAPPPAPVTPAPVDVPQPSAVPNGSTDTIVPSTFPTTIPSRGAEHEHARPEATEHVADGTTIPFGVAGSVLVAAGSLGLITLLRRRQLQRRHVGHALPRLSDEFAATEIAMRAAAEGTSAPWLDLALRALGAQLRIPPGEPAPQPVAAHLTSDELVITLAEPNARAPKPWTTSAPGWRWHLPLSTPTAELEQSAADACAPMPALVTIGNSPDGPVMLDLEACGLVTITGTADEARGLARSAALELAVSPIADELDVLVVGEDPLVLPSGTLNRVKHVRTISDVVALVAEQAHASIRALDDVKQPTTFTARCANDGSDPWAPTVLILDVAPDASEREQLEAFVETGGRGLGILAIGNWPDAPWHLHINNGQIDAPRLGLHGLTATIEAQRVEPTVANATVQLFEQANDDSDELLVQYDVVDPAPRTDEQLPAVDAPISVHVFGAVHVVGATRPLTDIETELVAFLATREHPVDADIVQTALWPDRMVSPKRWWNLVSETRKALGVDRNGEFHLPPLSKGQPLRLAPGVATDLTRIETAFRRVRNEATADAACELGRALGDVHGRPFDAKRGYAWVHANGLASYAEALIADAVHAMAVWCLDHGDVDETLRVIAIGLRASPGNEILYRDLILAHERSGDTRAVENAMRDLLETLETTDPYSDLQPETLGLYERASGRLPNEGVSSLRGTARPRPSSR